MSKGLGQKIVLKFTEALTDPGYVPSYNNIALGKPVTSDQTLTQQVAGFDITDNDTNTANYVNGGIGPTYVQVDLGEATMISGVTVWHYYSDGRIYNGTKVEVSIDGETWITVFDSAVSGTYAESSSGKSHIFQPILARYVRDWLNGSNKNTGNHWVEIKIFDSVRAYPKESFTITGQERKHVRGPLIAGDYKIKTATLYPIPIVWQEDFINATFSGIEVSGNGLKLEAG